MFKDFLTKIYAFLSDRMLILFVAILAAFGVLCATLFNIQIVNGRDYQSQTKKTYTNTLTVAAPRGEIFDRYGRPLAINKTMVMVKFDPTVKVSAQTEVLINFVRLMNRNGETIICDLPISNPATDGEPRSFLFNGSISREERWKKDMEIDLGLSPQEAYDALIKKFNIPVDSLTPDEAWTVLSLNQSLYMQRFSREHFTVSIGISNVTAAALEERNQDFPGIYIDVDYIREYPDGEYTSHIIGYIRKITAEQLVLYESYGYTADDIVGQAGIEQAFELQLRGETGKVKIEVDSSGRRIGTLSNEEAVLGNNTFLTLDKELQIKIYHILENQLAEIIISKLQASRSSAEYVSVRELLVSMIKANTISVNAVMTSDESCLAYPVKKYVLERSGLDPQDENYRADLVTFVADSLEKGRITENQIILAMYEQGLCTPTDAELDRLKKGSLYTLGFIVRMMEEGVITPQMTNIHPCTGSVVVIDVNTGAVLAAVSYPTYDNNQFVNTFNGAYYSKLLNDPTLPMYNRAFAEPRAVGSTFKMITALAGLESGVITTKTTIRDEGTFTKAGHPYSKCGGGYGGHGSVNVTGAIEVSCNYFFYETAYRLGSTKDGTKIEGIRKLNEYMDYFGLASPTGVEIYEYYDTRFSGLPVNVTPISSPEYKKYLYPSSNAAASSLWTDGDTIRTAIGQAFNNYTPATMAKYFATLASGGTRYSMHFLDRIQSSGGEIINEYTPVVETVVPIQPQNLKAIYDGMLAVTQGSRGTASKYFKDFPVKVAGKTGTAQETNFPNHTAFGAFAPYDDPQIAIYVQMPGSYQSAITYPAAKAAREILGVYFGLDAEPQRPVASNVLAK